LTTTESFDFVGPPHTKGFAIEKGGEMAKEVRTVWWWGKVHVKVGC